MGLGLFKKRTAEEKAQRKKDRQFAKAMKKKQRAYKKHISKNQTSKEKRKKFINRVKNFATGIGKAGIQVAKKTWNSPNTALGVTFGATLYGVGKLGYWTGVFDDNPSIDFGNNAIQFHDIPFAGAMTLGNSILYGPGYKENKNNEHLNGSPSGYTIGMEEGKHTQQGDILGPLYLPAHIAGGISSVFRNKSSQFKKGTKSDLWHQNNFMELGPMQGNIFKY